MTLQVIQKLKLDQLELEAEKKPQFRDKWMQKEAKVRGTVKRILKCDVTRSNPLEPLLLPAADCLLSFLCLQVASKDEDSFYCVLKNISSLLKPGGYLVTGGVLGGLEVGFDLAPAWDPGDYRAIIIKHLYYKERQAAEQRVKEFHQSPKGQNGIRFQYHKLPGAFNPKDYLETYYGAESGLLISDGYLQFILKNLYKTFTSAGDIKGDILVDIGSGASIYTFLSACESFTEIIATDYTDRNRQELKLWLNKEPEAFDWSAVVKLACELEGDRDKWTEKEAKVRETVKRVLKCDVTRNNPLEPLMLPAADCLLTCLCLQAACKNEDAVYSALKNMSSLLKPGGYLVMGGVLGSTFYTVGHKTFGNTPLHKDLLEKAISEAGFEILELVTQNHTYPVPITLSDYYGHYFILARKQSNTS
uniref:Nicotinamide N-methyltransferase-like n=1 Tax=Geotrypetes seraphini TaxID=260995 RepID=A0A6P8PIS4_GEOSA|nr:nicotinamide N-methyltransferase-like [Geotrypetes seraphini]